MLNPNNYPDAAIEAALRGYGGIQPIGFRYDLLDRDSVKTGVLDGIESAGVSHNDFRTIKRTASFNLTENGLRRVREINYLADRIQPWFILKMPDGGRVEWPLGIFLLESPERSVNGPLKRRSIGGYDLTLVIDQYKLANRQYFPAGTLYTAAVEQLLTMGGMARIGIEPSALTMAADKEFALGTSCREAVTGLLDAINYQSLYIDAEGYARSGPYVPPAQREATRSYSADRHSVIAPGFTDSLDIANRANVFILHADNVDGGGSLTSIYRNDDPRSPLSTVSRGREIMDYRQVTDIADQDTLDAKCKRIAIDATSAYRHIKFSTALMPVHGAAETLWLDIPGLLDVPGKFTETAWGMDLSAGGTMTHEARAVIDL